MTEAERHAVWAAQLKLLEAFDGVCRRHGLTYFAGGGKIGMFLMAESSSVTSQKLYSLLLLLLRRTNILPFIPVEKKSPRERC